MKRLTEQTAITGVLRFTTFVAASCCSRLFKNNQRFETTCYEYRRRFLNMEKRRGSTLVHGGSPRDSWSHKRQSWKSPKTRSDATDQVTAQAITIYVDAHTVLVRPPRLACSGAWTGLKATAKHTTYLHKPPGMAQRQRIAPQDVLILYMVTSMAPLLYLAACMRCFNPNTPLRHYGTAWKKDPANGQRWPSATVQYI